MTADPSPEPSRSLLERLRRDFGADVDPGIELEAAEGAQAGPRADEQPSGVVERMKERGGLAARYRLEGEVARGGMGAILSAWDGDLRRRVAMKVALGAARGGGTGEEVDPRLLARFLEEAQVTGQLEHPGIVPVHELGVADDGRVYFTMRFVRGRDLEAVFGLVDAGLEGWSVTRALGVLSKVCEAMAYAHSKGVVHRDLKPGNVMVGHFGEVYVMDWGLVRVRGQEDRHDLRLQGARALAAERGEEPGGENGGERDAARPAALDLDRRQDASGGSGEELYTMDGDVVGTPAYMSPEQARGELEALDARSDVYSLGAMLYRLLARVTPYGSRTERHGAAQILGELLAGPPAALETLAPRAPAELVAICDKAMARDPRERYPDMVALAEDLRAFLEHRVVRAHETGALAEARKWVRRNRPLAASLAAGVLALAAGLVASLVLRARAETSAASARRQARIAEEVNGFLNRDLLAAVRPEEQGIDVSLREALEVAATRLEGRFAGEPAVEAELRLTIATSLQSLGELEPARAQAERALELLRGALGERAGPTLGAMGRVAAIQRGLGRNEESLALLRRAVELCEQELGAEHRTTLNLRGGIATTLDHLGRFEEARAAYEDVLAAQRRVLPAGDDDLLATLNNLGSLSIHTGEFARGETLLREAVALRRRRDGDRHPETLTAIDTLAQILGERGELEESEALLLEATAAREEVLGPDHPDTAQGLSNLASLYKQRDRYPEARQACEKALEGLRRAYGDDHPRTLLAENNLATILERMGELDEALELRLATLAAQRRVLGARHPETLLSMSNLAILYQMMGRMQEAEALQLETLQAQRETLGADHPFTLVTLENYGNLLFRRRDYQGALEAVSQVLEARRRVLGEIHPAVAKTTFNLGMIASETGDRELARALFEESLGIGRAVPGGAQENVAECQTQLAKLDLDAGALPEAVERYREALAVRRALGLEDESLGFVLHQLGFCLNRLGEPEAAVLPLSEALALRRRLFGDDDTATITTLSSLVPALLHAGRYAQCEPLALELHEQSVAAGRPSEPFARDLLRELYQAWGKPDEALRWR